jgi:hypothetical protein
VSLLHALDLIAQRPLGHSQCVLQCSNMVVPLPFPKSMPLFLREQTLLASEYQIKESVFCFPILVFIDLFIGGGLLTPDIKVPSDLFSFSHTRNAARMEVSRLKALRTLSTSRHGIWATVGEQVGRWQWSQDPSRQDYGTGPRPRMGIGLPMSNIFATYFGGSLDLVSLDGWGTDAYLRLPKLVCLFSKSCKNHI